jgi:hypothetical protein
MAQSRWHLVLGAALAGLALLAGCGSSSSNVLIIPTASPTPAPTATPHTQRDADVGRRVRA